MRPDWSTVFLRYALTGGLNTAVHWAVFGVLWALGSPQSRANLCAFLVAVTVSFFVNAAWTFKARPTLPRYVLMVFLMGGLSWTLGRVADQVGLHPLMTLVAFSGTSLIIGFLLSKLLIFRERQ